MYEDLENITQFKFTDACRIGVPIIDTEHEHIFELLNKVIESVHSPHIDMISLDEYSHILLHYGLRHFAHEERYMEKIHDRELVHQRLAHRTFLNKVKAIDLHGLTEEEKEPLVVELIDYTLNWLYKHVLYSDILIGKIVHLADRVHREDLAEGEEAEYCPFEDRLYTGDEVLDAHNKEMFELLNKAYNVMEMNYSESEYDHEMRILDELDHRMSEHFHEEEEDMHGIHYADYREHCNAHSACIGRLFERDDAHDAPDPKEYIEEMLDFLYAWLTTHIIRMDKPFVEWIQSKKNKN